MRRYKTAFLLFFVGCLSLFAQVKLTLQAPRQTEVGQRIRVSYVANTQDVEDIQTGDFPGFRLLYGPSTSSSSSFSIINGKTTQSSTLTFTYTLIATEEGKHNIPAATIIVGGKSYTSNTGTIEVLPGSDDSEPDANSGSNGNPQRGANNNPRVSRGRQSGSTNITDKELYMTVTASKKSIYEQEAVLLTYKLYSLVNIQQLSGEMPQLDGCHVQEVDRDAQMSLKYERVNGRNYATGVWRQYVIYPQKSGKITIPSVTFDSQVEVQNLSADPFDIFFGGGSLSQMVRKQIVTPVLEIDVKALPSPKPDNFSGAVGKFTISGSLTPEQVNANDAATLRLVVSGQGNMKLMKAPKVNFPQDFEIYDPKENDKTTNTSTGAKGNFIYDYVVVPRHGGKFSVAPVEFTYFDPEKASYQTLMTDSFHIAVAKAKGGSEIGNYHEQEDLKVLSKDIRFIKLGEYKSQSADEVFFASGTYWMIYIILFLAFIAVVVVFNRQIKENANVARQRGKKAGKAASKRLKNAASMLKIKNSGPFYDEVMRALLGYVGDKLNLPTSDLTKDYVAEKLSAKGIEPEIVSSFMDVLGECEFARYAPGDPVATMDKIFRNATDVINRLDSKL